jgi:hypothetical protein
VIEPWRMQHKTVRPHSLGYRPPAPMAILPITSGKDTNQTTTTDKRPTRRYTNAPPGTKDRLRQVHGTLFLRSSGGNVSV